MKKSKLLLCVLFALIFVFAFAACKGEATYYTVSFDSAGGSAVQDRAIENGSVIIEPDAPTRTGYTFAGWYNGETKWNFETDTVKSDIKLTAKWDRIPHTVTFNSDGGSAVDNQTVYNGNLIEAPQNPTKANHRFIGWYKDDVAWDFAFNTVTADITLTAKWEAIITYTVSFNSDGGSAVTEQIVEKGLKAAEPTAPTKAGYAFDGWYNGETRWNFAADTVTSNVTLTAKWKVTLTVTFNSNGGSEVAAIEVPIGDKISRPTVSKTNGILIGWFIGDSDVEWDFDTDVVTEPITLRAEWIITTPPMPL
jgi:uncharacterized repeat protein (TIGR02543 family)